MPVFNVSWPILGGGFAVWNLVELAAPEIVPAPNRSHAL